MSRVENADANLASWYMVNRTLVAHRGAMMNKWSYSWSEKRKSKYPIIQSQYANPNCLVAHRICLCPQVLSRTAKVHFKNPTPSPYDFPSFRWEDSQSHVAEFESFEDENKTHFFFWQKEVPFHHSQHTIAFYTISSTSLCAAESKTACLFRSVLLLHRVVLILIMRWTHLQALAAWGREATRQFMPRTFWPLSRSIPSSAKHSMMHSRSYRLTHLTIAWSCRWMLENALWCSKGFFRIFISRVDVCLFGGIMADWYETMGANRSRHLIQMFWSHPRQLPSVNPSSNLLSPPPPICSPRS